MLILSKPCWQSVLGIEKLGGLQNADILQRVLPKLSEGNGSRKGSWPTENRYQKEYRGRVLDLDIFG